MLRIDLLPPGIKARRVHRLLIILIVVVIVVEGGALFAMYSGIKAKRAATEEELAKVTKVADQVRDLKKEIGEKEGLLQPIADKITFVEEANASGEQYWERFHAINEYIYEKAEVTRFSITNPDSVNFDVIVGDTTEAARFVLNLMMCPAITNLSVSGLPAGVSIEGVGGGGGGGGGFTPMGGAEEGMPAEEPGMEAEMGMGPGMGGPTPAASAEGDITLSITATLTEQVSEPMPDGGAGGGAPGGMGMPGEPGMPGEGMPGEEMPPP